MQVKRTHKTLTVDDIIKKYSIQLPMFFQSRKNHKLLVHPYNYFDFTSPLNFYSYNKGVLIFKSRDFYYITIHTKIFESILEVNGYQKVNTFPGFNFQELKPVDSDAKELWNKLIANFSEK